MGIEEMAAGRPAEIALIILVLLIIIVIVTGLITSPGGATDIRDFIVSITRGATNFG